MMAQSEATTTYRLVHKETFWLVGIGGCGLYTGPHARVLPLWEAFVRRASELPSHR